MYMLKHKMRYHNFFTLEQVCIYLKIFEFFLQLRIWLFAVAIVKAATIIDYVPRQVLFFGHYSNAIE